MRASDATTNLYVRLQKADQTVVSMVGVSGLTYLASLDWVNVVATAGRARECVPFLKMLRTATVPMLGVVVGIVDFVTLWLWSATKESNTCHIHKYPQLAIPPLATN